MPITINDLKEMLKLRQAVVELEQVRILFGDPGKFCVIDAK